MVSVSMLVGLMNLMIRDMKNGTSNQELRALFFITIHYLSFKPFKECEKTLYVEESHIVSAIHSSMSHIHLKSYLGMSQIRDQ